MTQELDVTVSNLSATATLADSDPAGIAARRASMTSWQGMVIGRYIALSQLGAGAMGVVLAAYDPQLDRKIALKLLVPHTRDAAAARARLQREAQALAKLDHPNVVAVRDVVVHGDQLFVAMDFVAGKTLGAWMSEVSRPRSYQDVLPVFVDAGHGLAAAHRAGLVHRDFKPDNVMLGDDARVRVMDFGLACAEFDLDEDSDDSTHAMSRLDQLTRTGAIMGTPAYMPLEQFEARETDARSDQFSFCVSLWQALYGERPFAGGTFEELQLALEHEQIQPAPRDSNVPAWLRKVMVRGLSKDPARRWPSMQALLDALTDDPAVRRRRWWAAAGLLVVLGGATWATIAATQREARVCHTAEDKLAGIWDDTHRAALEQAMLGTNLSYASETWERVERHLDDYADAWVTARTEACEATHAGDQSSELMDLRMACLDDRLSSLRETIEELELADEISMKNAVQAVLSLPSLDRCADIEALLAEVPPPDDPALAERVHELDERLLEARAKQDAGRYADGLKIADEVVVEAEQLDHEPLRVRAWLYQADLQREMAEYGLAEASLKKAFTAAVAQRMSMEAMTASVDLVNLVGVVLDRYDDGRRWATFAEPLSRAVGTDSARADYLTVFGVMRCNEGNRDDARALLEEALAIRENTPERDPNGLAVTLKGLGMVAAYQGRVDESYVYFERVTSVFEATFGPQHPKMLSALSNLALAESMRGDVVAARKSMERVLVMQEQMLGPEHPSVALTLYNLAGMEVELNQLQDALIHHKRALVIQEQHFGRNHPDTGATLLALGLNEMALQEREAAQAYLEQALAAFQASAPESGDVGNIYRALGDLAKEQHDFARARAYGQRAQEIIEREFGPEHLQVAHGLMSLANIAYEEADFEEARRFYDRALPIYEKALGPDHVEVADQVCRSSRILLATGGASEAIAEVERALQIADERNPQVLARCRFALADSLWEAPVEQGRDRARARDLALLAREFYGETGDPMLDDWLRTHGG